MTGFGDALAPGTRLRGGEFEIGAVLGRGGFGITYQARDLGLLRDVAIKEFFPVGAARDEGEVVAPREDDAGFDAAREAFLAEARALARFDHRGIVRVFGVWEERATAYMAMELLRGPTLGARVEAAGPMREADALKWMRQVAEALCVVHGAGLLHGDVQPENIIVTGAGDAERAVLLDFGLAAPTGDGNGLQTVALNAARRLGTQGFAAPEQYGRAPRGPYTDIYALGATLWFLLTAQAPPAATDRAAGAEMKDEGGRMKDEGQGPQLHPSSLIPHPSSAGAVSASMRAAVERAMRLSSRERPQSVDAWLQLLNGGANVPVALPVKVPVMAATTPVVTAASVLRAPRFYIALTGHAGKVRAVAWARDGKSLAAACDNRALWLWDMEAVAEGAGQNGKLSRRAGARLLAAHGDWVRALAWSPDGRELASAGSDKTVCFWEMNGASGAVLRARIEGGAGEIGALSWVGDEIATGGRDGRVRLTGAALAGDDAGLAWRVLEERGGWIRALAAFGRGDSVACGGDDGVIRLWRGHRDGAATRWEWRGGVEAHTGGVLALDFAPLGAAGALMGAAGDAVLLASAGGRDGAVKVWAAGEALELWRTLSEARGAATSVAWSPDGRVLAGGSLDKNVRLWDVASGALMAVLPEHPSGVYSVAWSPDGRFLAVGSEREVWLWRVST